MILVGDAVVWDEKDEISSKLRSKLIAQVLGWFSMLVIRCNRGVCSEERSDCNNSVLLSYLPLAMIARLSPERVGSLHNIRTTVWW
jgi:hypothetical protein